MSCHYRTTPVFPGAVILGDFTQMQRHDPIPRLAPGVGLIVVLLLSVALWGAVWVATSELAEVWSW